MKKKFPVSQIILSLSLIAAGCFFGYLFFSFIEFKWRSLLLLLYIPTFCVIVVVPVYAGVAYLIEIFKHPEKKQGE